MSNSKFAAIPMDSPLGRELKRLLESHLNDDDDDTQHSLAMNRSQINAAKQVVFEQTDATHDVTWHRWEAHTPSDSVFQATVSFWVGQTYNGDWIWNAERDSVDEGCGGGPYPDEQTARYDAALHLLKHEYDRLSEMPATPHS